MFQFGAKKLSPAELEAQRKKHAAEAKAICLAAAEQEKRQKERTADRKRELMREWQQRFRDHKKAAGGSTSKKVKLAVLGGTKRTIADDLIVAETSWPDGMKWKGQRTGKKNGVV